jgi:pimeloyl-ACP methyl ester carboxylesterase
MYMTSLCWEHWTGYFERQAIDAAPDWPGGINRWTCCARLTRTRVGSAYVASHCRISGTVRSLDEKPILIGHSMGGLVVQLLLQQDIAAAGVAIDPAPPQGVFTFSWPFLRSNWPHITPFVAKDHPIWMTLERFQYTFTNALPPAEQRSAYDRYVVPESRRVPAQALTRVARIYFGKPRPPLLLIAGSEDHLIPPALVRANFRRYGRSSSSTDFREFPGRRHFIIGQTGWKEVADAVLSWLQQRGI